MEHAPRAGEAKFDAHGMDMEHKTRATKVSPSSVRDVGGSTLNPKTYKSTTLAARTKATYDTTAQLPRYCLCMGSTVPRKFLGM
jgi:hypothetical protein